MDNAMLKVGVLAAIGIVLLLPTFNALNNSYVQDVPPPPWIPTPSTIPDDFEPPPDFKPPPDFEPPPDFDASKYKGKIPPGGCPPPVLTVIPEWTANHTFRNGQPDVPLTDETIDVNASVYAIVGYVNVTDYQGNAFDVTVRPASGKAWNGHVNDTLTGFPVRTPTSSETHNWEYNSYNVTGKQAAPGKWTLAWNPPNFALNGLVETIFVRVIPCGGLLQ